jgi:hypothetical protein
MKRFLGDICALSHTIAEAVPQAFWNKTFQPVALIASWAVHHRPLRPSLRGSLRRSDRVSCPVTTTSRRLV